MIEMTDEEFQQLLIFSFTRGLAKRFKNTHIPVEVFENYAESYYADASLLFNGVPKESSVS